MIREVLGVIQVVCDDPRHARGKVAKVTRVTVYTGGGWTEEKPDARRKDRAVRKAEAGVVRDGEKFMAATFGLEKVRCKLCGRGFRPGSGVAFGQAVRQLALDRVELVRLAELAAIIDRSERA